MPFGEDLAKRDAIRGQCGFGTAWGGFAEAWGDFAERAPDDPWRFNFFSHWHFAL